MCEANGTTADPTFGLSTGVDAVHCDEPVEVQVRPSFQLWVLCADGTQGLVDMRALVHSEHAGVFAFLADPKHFACVRVTDGAISWPNGADLAPDAMYEALRSSGSWVLE